MAHNLKLGWQQNLTVFEMALSNLLKPMGTTTQAPTQPKPQVVETPKVAREVVSDTPKSKIIPKANTQFRDLFVDDLQRNLRKAEVWFGGPGTGKTTKAKLLAQQFKREGLIDDYAIINCHEEMTYNSVLITTRTDENGAWVFKHNKAFNMLTDELQKRYMIIFDEYNLLSMSVQKATQPILDDTQGDFDFNDTTYEKNPNIYFVVTMNHKDLGISDIPLAVKDRLFPQFFEELSIDELSKRSGVPSKLIELLGKVRQMFEHLGDIPEFHKSVRQLSYLRGANGNMVREYMISQLALAKVEYKEAIAMSPEFQNLIDEFNNYTWKKA